MFWYILRRRRDRRSRCVPSKPPQAGYFSDSQSMSELADVSSNDDTTDEESSHEGVCIYQRREVHSILPYPGTLRPGTARNSDTTRTQNTHSSRVVHVQCLVLSTSMEFIHASADRISPRSLMFLIYNFVPKVRATCCHYHFVLTSNWSGVFAARLVEVPVSGASR